MKSKYDAVEFNYTKEGNIHVCYEWWLIFNTETKEMGMKKRYLDAKWGRERKWVGNPNPDLYNFDFDSYIIMKINIGFEEIKEVDKVVCLYEKIPSYEIFN